MKKKRLAKQIGERIREARGSLSQSELAAKLKVNYREVSRWETGAVTPSVSKLVALACALEVSLDSLAGKDEKKTLPASVHSLWKVEDRSWSLA